MIDVNSLAVTLDGVNEALFESRPLAIGETDNLTRWLASRQWQSGNYAGLFAPTETDYQAGVRLFTGERLRTQLATRNVLTAEAARALFLLDLPAVWREVWQQAEQRLLREGFAAQLCVTGECAHSGVAWMRYLAASGRDDREERLMAHLRVLAEHHDGSGRWRRFPFHYTLLALSEIDLPAAVAELRCAAPACERALRRSRGGDRYARRRRAVIEKVLSRCATGVARLL